MSMIFRIIDENRPEDKQYVGVLVVDEHTSTIRVERTIRTILETVLNTLKQTKYKKGNWDIYDLEDCLPKELSCRSFCDGDYRDKVIKLEKDDKE